MTADAKGFLARAVYAGYLEKNVFSFEVLNGTNASQFVLGGYNETAYGNSSISWLDMALSSGWNGTVEYLHYNDTDLIVESPPNNASNYTAVFQ